MNTQNGELSIDRPLVIEQARIHAPEMVTEKAEIRAAEVADLRAAALRFGVDVVCLVAAAWRLVLARYADEETVGFVVVADAHPEHQMIARLSVALDLDRPLSALVRDVDTALRAGSPPADAGSPREVLARVLRVGAAAARADEDQLELSVSLEGKPALTLRHDRGRLLEGIGVHLLAQLHEVLRAFAAVDPAAAARGVSVLGEAERRRMLFEWNETAVEASDRPTLHELFERQARETPGATAVQDPQRRLTYLELEAASSGVAATLRRLGIGKGDYVCVHLERTVDVVVALLGVLKSGAAYVPVEISLPAHRVRMAIESVAAAVVLCSPDRAGLLAEMRKDLPSLKHVLPVADNDGRRPADPRPGGVADRVVVSDNDTAYVIFTSGSTGVPKGVEVAHTPVVNVIRWVNDTFSVGPRDKLLFVTSLSFDLSVYDVFGILAAGGSIRVASEAELAEPSRLLAVMQAEQVTFWDSAPAMFQQIEQMLPMWPSSAQSSLRLVFLSGDWVPLSLPAAIRSAFPAAEVVALGGATEAAIWSNYFRVETVKPEWVSIPYGRPIRNARYYVLDERGEPAPVGVPGDLFIGGPCLARGYHNDPELTRRRFLADPFDPRPGARLYHTGDRARFWPDGTIEFLGRQDSQIKIRGYRIELGEIESVLCTQPDVHMAVASVHRDGDSTVLCGYVVGRPGAEPDLKRLRSFLAERLPSYMVPDHIEVIARVPMTRHGKLDRSALPVPVRASAPGQPAAPQTPAEMAIAAIWAEVIGVAAVGREDDFFRLGGNSLLATRATARVRFVLEVDVTLRALLENPVLADFAKVVEASRVPSGGSDPQ